MTQDEFESVCADLAEAIRRSDMLTLERIVRVCPRVLTEQPFGQHPMHWAARSNNFDAIKYLLSIGVSPDVRSDDSFNTPLFSAAVQGHLQAGEVLLRAGATLSPLQRDGRPASLSLHTAANSGHLAFVKMLVEAGCDVNLAWSNTDIGDPPRNALTWALMYGQTEVAEYLRSVGAETVEELGLVQPSPKKRKKK